MSLLDKILKRDTAVATSAIPDDIYKSVHVMRDDLNKIEGKPSETAAASSVPAVDEHPNHPFLSTGSAAATPVASPPPQATTPSKKSPVVWKKFLVPGLIGLALIIVGVGIFFYFRTSAPLENLPLPEVPVSEEPAPEVSSESLSPVAFPFSLDKPNYLVLDPESDMATPEGIVAKLKETGMAVKEARPSKPVEFLLRDGNNNPIAFSRFSYLMRLGIKEEVLALFGEPFSIYFVPQGEEIRMTLALEVKDKESLESSLKQEEEKIPGWFDPLLYKAEGISVPATVSFRSGTYGALATRFAIIDEPRQYSFDYAFLEGWWIFGTSKDSFRATIDTLIQGGAKREEK